MTSLFAQKSFESRALINGSLLQQAPSHSISYTDLISLKMPASEEALALKKKGNEAVSKHEWLNAIDFYTKAIESYDTDPIFYSNRCQVSYLTGKTVKIVSSNFNDRRTSSWNSMDTQLPMQQKPLVWTNHTQKYFRRTLLLGVLVLTATGILSTSGRLHSNTKFARSTERFQSSSKARAE